MWMECPGSMAFTANQVDGDSSEFADNGTASHTLGAWALQTGKDCSEFPHNTIRVNNVEYDVDEERCGFVQTYVDDVRRSAMGGILWTEYRVDLSKYLGMAVCPTCKGKGHTAVPGQGCPDSDPCNECDASGEIPQGGTSDAVVIVPKDELLIVGDLKYGVGERVYASYYAPDGKTKRINHQLGLYALGVLEDVLLLGHKITRVIVRIYQPRLNILDEFEISADELMNVFGAKAKLAVETCGDAMVLSETDPALSDYLLPGDKTCRWCRVKAKCPALRRYVAEQTRMDFNDETSPPVVPESTEHLSVAFKAMPLILQWVKATQAAIWNGVVNGDSILGPDQKPLKLVAGKEGNNAWVPEALLSGQIEALLVGQLGPKAYQVQKPISAPEAKKLLGKKATKKLWDEQFAPLIKRGKPGPMIALGSDTRPVYGERVAAVADEFENEEIGVEE
jgi:hypothetical protein